jgi:hypothetical protein
MGRQVPCVRKLVRATARRRTGTTRIELWLARTLGHLPARLRVIQAGGDVADQQSVRTLPAEPLNPPQNAPLADVAPVSSRGTTLKRP